MIYFANDTSIRLRLIGYNCHGPVQPHTLNRLVQIGLRGFRIAPCGQAKVDYLTVRINSPPQVAPFTADANVGLVHVPVDTGAEQMLFGPLGQFRAKFLNPTIDSSANNGDPSFHQQINHILIG